VLGAAAALSALLYLGGCGGSEEPALTEDEYVDAYVEILRAIDEEPDEVAASERAQEIMKRRGITEEDLVEFAQRHRDDPKYLAEVWRRIEMRLRNPEPADTAQSADTVRAEGGGG
jgi:hypothetical protein